MKWVNQYNIQEEIKASETLRNHKQIPVTIPVF